MDIECSVIERDLDLFNIGKELVATFDTVFLKRDIVDTKNHILRWCGDRFTGGWKQNVHTCKHQNLCFSYGFGAEWYMHCHLVTVKVGVERRTDEWMKLNRLTVNEAWVKRLNGELVKCRCTVEHNRISINYLVETLPHFICLLLDHFLGGFDRCRIPFFFEFCDQVWFEQFKRHLLRQSTLIHLQIRPDNDNRTPGEVDTLTKKVLSKSSLLTFNDL